MTSSPTTTKGIPLCSTRKDFRSACFGAASFGNAGKPYCLFHFPSTKKSQDFRVALNERLEKKNYDFRGVWFPYEVSFAGHSFETNAVFIWAVFNAKADFTRANFGARANFSNAHFNFQADFYAANFRARTNFDAAEFRGNANFAAATFGATSNFHSASFWAKASFYSAAFHDRTTFGSASFRGEVNFRLTNFKSYVRFARSKTREVFLDGSWLDLREVKLDKPELVSFHTLSLCPNWFVEVNASKFDFINVEWRPTTVRKEVSALRKFKSIESPYRLLAIACWYLAVNAEENHRYEEGSRFRYMAMNARRQSWREGKAHFTRLFRSLKGNQKEREKWLTGFKQFWKSFCKDLSPLHWLYWAVSGYGEKILRALVILLGILVVFAGLYAANAGDQVGPGLRILRALSYSASVMTLQKPEPSSSIFVRGLVTLETVMSPVQAALLALAIRRKFMR